MILSEQKLRKLSGYKRPSKQIAWLKRHGLRFFIAADGHPRVPESNFITPQNQRVNAPDFSSLRKSS